MERHAGGQRRYPAGQGVAIPLRVAVTGLRSRPGGLHWAVLAAAWVTVTFGMSESAVAVPPPRPVLIDRGVPLVSLACPSPVECVALDNPGSSIARELTFNPRAPGHPIPVPIGIAASERALACPTTTQCTAEGGIVDGTSGRYAGGREVTFNPLAPGEPTPHIVQQSDDPSTLQRFETFTCPTVTQCTALTASSSTVTFDPESPAAVGAVPFASGTGLFLDIACPSATECVSVGGLTVSSGGATTEAVMINPQSSASPTVSRHGEALGPTVVCPGLTECVSVNGRAETTFDPTKTQSGSQAAIAPREGPGLPGGGSVYLDRVVCPSRTQCSASDVATGYAITFNPLQPAIRTPIAVDPGPLPVKYGPSYSTALTCPATTLCTIVDSLGRVVTFNPNRLTAPCIAPKLSGQTLAQVRRALRAANCTLGAVSWRHSKVKTGRIVSQSPPAGGQPRSGRVSVVLSSGQP